MLKDLDKFHEMLPFVLIINLNPKLHLLTKQNSLQKSWMIQFKEDSKSTADLSYLRAIIGNYHMSVFNMKEIFLTFQLIFTDNNLT